MRILPVLPLIVIACIGCSSKSAPSRPPRSQAELQAWDRLRANEAHASQLLECGDLHAGQSVTEALGLCTPYGVNFVDRYAFIEFYSIPNLTGLSLIAIDGKLVWARSWGCNHSTTYFETISKDQLQGAWDAYGARVFGHDEWERQR